MGLLQYTSNEMFSSTELVRKSKNIFDKLNKNEIEKAIVLRDGKPGIILLDFDSYAPADSFGHLARSIRTV